MYDSIRNKINQLLENGELESFKFEVYLSPDGKVVGTGYVALFKGVDFEQAQKIKNQIEEEFNCVLRVEVDK